MRYYFRHETLFLRGTFRAVSTGAGGGLADVATILNHTVGYDFSSDDPVRYLAGLVAAEGLPPEFFGLLTAVRMRTLCILQYDFLTVFVTAGVEPAPAEGPGTINIIVRSEEGMTDGALCESIIVATGAKTRALHAAGYACTGTPTDAVIAACDREAPIAHRYAGPLTAVGSRLSEAAEFGVAEALKRHEGKIRTHAPSFFIFSRYGGDHWVLWDPAACPYYPCHMPGQACDFCYCPFYPCGDPALGAMVPRSTGGVVWSCEHCTLLHDPDTAAYLKRYPEASLAEVKQFRKKKSC